MWYTLFGTEKHFNNIHSFFCWYALEGIQIVCISPKVYQLYTLLAQLVEHLVYIQSVGGSSPSGSTKKQFLRKRNREAQWTVNVPPVKKRLSGFKFLETVV